MTLPSQGIEGHGPRGGGHPGTGDARFPLRRSLVAKLTFFVGLTLAALIAVLLAAGYYVGREVLREEIDAHLSSVAASRRDMVQAHISQLKQRAELLADHGEFRGLFHNMNMGEPDAGNRAFSQGMLDEMADGKTIFSAFLADAKGRVLLASKGTEPGGEVADDPAFEKGMSGPHVGIPRRAGDHFEVVLSAPILDYGDPPKGIAVLMMTADVSSLAGAVRDTTGLGQSGEVLLAIREGDAAHALFPLRHWDEARAIPLARVPAMVAALEGRRFLGTTLDYRGERVLAASMPVGYGSWALMAKMDEREAYAPIARVLRYGLLSGGTVAAAGLVAAYLLARGVTRPVRRLVRAAARVAHGDYPPPVPIKSGDEFGVLSASFNDMTAAIRTRGAERDAKEEALRESEGRLRLALAAGGMGVCVADLTPGGTASFDEQARGIMGLAASPREWRMEEIFEKLIHPDDRERLQAGFARMLERRRGAVVEYRIIRPDGSVRWLQGAATTQQDAAGMPVRFIGVSFDITERKQAEEMLRKSEERYRYLFDSIDEGFCVIEVIFDEHEKAVDFRFLEVNPSFAKQSGLQEAEGKRMRELAPNHEEHWFETFGKVALTGEPVRFVNEAQELNDRWFDVYAFRLGGPESSRVAILFRDITESKLAEEQVLRANRRLTFLSEASAGLLGSEDPVVFLALIFQWLNALLDVELCLHFVNEDDRSLRLVLHHGVAEEDTAGFRQLAFGQGVCGAAAAERQPYVLENVQGRSDAMTAIARGLGLDAYACLPLVAGERLLGTLSLGSRRRSRFDEEEIALFQSVAHEVAMALARQQAEAAVRESEERLRLITDLVPHPIFAKDVQGRFIFVNRAFAAAFCTSPEQLLGHTDEELLPDKREVGAFRESDMAVIESGVPIFIPEEPFTSPDGRAFILQTTKIPFTVPGTGEPAVLGVAMDITARKHAEEEVRRLNASLEQRVAERTAQLDEANRDLESFSYSVSHDLRAPLRAVNGYARILLHNYGERLDSEGRRLAEVIRHEGERMGRLIDALLDFSRLGRQAISATSIDMTALAREAFDEAAAEAPERKVEFRLGDLPEAQGDATLLRQVFVNLFSNAVKFTRPQEHAVIEAGARTEDGQTVYWVRDNGAGFDPRYADQLFGVFQRLHRQDEFEGTGVGLAFVQRIVQRHAGRIWAEGKPGEGATFYFTLRQPEAHAKHGHESH